MLISCGSFNECLVQTTERTNHTQEDRDTNVHEKQVVSPRQSVDHNYL